MSLFEWMDLSTLLACDGLELYYGFLPSHDSAYLQKVKSYAKDLGMGIPMMCYSPDFTVLEKELLEQEIEKQKKAIRVTAELGGQYCRVLSGQKRPGLTFEKGIASVVYGIESCIPEAEKCGVTLVMENHYKDGYWRYPEFAQKQEIFLAIIEQINSPVFGVQYDPSNAIVAGEDPLDLLDRVAERVKTMHASDRYIEKGYTIEEVMRYVGQAGYHPALKHGVVGRGLNDYDAIFHRLAQVGFDGWISIEDGMNGLEEMKQSVEFLKNMRDRFFPEGDKSRTLRGRQ